jgi:hypothetical protein
VEDAVHIACQTKALTQNLGGPATEEEIGYSEDSVESDR